MSRTLTVHCNRDRGDSVAVDCDRLDVTGTFAVELTNHGSPVHVHLHLDDSLSLVARLETTNVYLREGDTEVVVVNVSDAAENVHGELDMVSGYGREHVTVPVFVDYESRESLGVDVDERLGEFQAGGSGEAGLNLLAADRLVPALVVLVGVLVTVVAAMVAGRVLAAMVAVVALLGSVSAAVFLYRQT